MSLADRLPSLDDKELANLHANARRLEGGETRHGKDAALLIPLIEAELAQRLALKPKKTTRKRVAAVASTEAEPVAKPKKAPRKSAAAPAPTEAEAAAKPKKPTSKRVA